MTDVVAQDPVSTRDLVGTEIQGLRVVELLGRGGMGEVYKAYDPHLDRHVAIKLVGELAAQEENFFDRFQREARVACQVQHPNVAQVHSAGVHRGRPFYVMEYVAGQSLGEVLEQKGGLSGFRCLNYLIQAAEGLRAAHQQGIIHRDIKPANLMLGPDGRLKIVDFGLARSVVRESTLTQTNALLGTPAYMAPEQALQSEIDHRADIYSLGATFYHLFAGQQPFRADTPMGLVMKHANEVLPPLKERNPRVPQAICAVVERMMAKEPADRYQSYGELIDELRRVEGGQVSATATAPTAALPRPAAQAAFQRPPPAGLPVWRQPWLWVVVVLVAAAGAVLYSGPDGTEDGAMPAESSSPEPVPGVGSAAPAVSVPRVPEESQASEEDQYASETPEGALDTFDPGWEDEDSLPSEATGDRPLRPGMRPRQGGPRPGVRPGLGPRPSEMIDPALAEMAEKHPMMAMAKKAQTMARLRSLHTAVQVYQAETAEPPADLKAVSEDMGLHPETLIDAWGEPIQYDSLGPESFRLSSAGQDGAFGTGDDIVLEDGAVVSGEL